MDGSGSQIVEKGKMIESWKNHAMKATQRLTQTRTWEIVQ